MSDLSMNFPQDQEKYETHNRCSVKGHWVNNSISKWTSPRKRKFQIWSSGKWFGVCFILMMNAIRRWSLELLLNLVSTMGMPLWIAKGTMLQTDLHISKQVPNAPFSAVWRVSVTACLWDTEDSAPATGHQSLASEVIFFCQWSIFKNQWHINSIIKIIYQSYQPQLPLCITHTFQTTWKGTDTLWQTRLVARPITTPLFCEKILTLIWFGLAMCPGLKGDYDKWETNWDNSIPPFQVQNLLT